MSVASVEEVETAVEAPPTPQAAPPAWTPRPLAVEWLALSAAFVALVALALTRVGMTDTPYHLATARWAQETGRWPATNTFSYTFPDFPLYQQYPLYQTILLRVYEALGWEGLSLLHFAAFLTIFLLWLAWMGGVRWAAVLSLPTMLLLLGLRERMVLRPDILTLTYFAVVLLLVDRARRTDVRWVYALPVVQLLWANSHQMFWLGLAIQGAFLVHLVVVRALGGRFGIADEDRAIPPRPVLYALALSVGVSFLTPLGLRVVEVPLHTMGSLYFHREHVEEFRPFYESPQAAWLVAASAFLAVAAAYLGRMRLQPFEWMIWGASAVMVAGAIRGAPFFIAVSIGIFARELRKSASAAFAGAAAQGGDRCMFAPRMAAAAVAVFLASHVLWHRWAAPSRILGGSQFGVGKTLGEWPDEATAFLKSNPPPGAMLNLGWYIGNAVVFELFPKHRVFVDPRFEAYPRQFLLEAVAAETDPIALDRLIDHYDPSWIVGELRIPGVRQQMARLLALGEWEPVFFDAVCAVLVRKRAETALYLKLHRVRPERVAPRGLLTDQPDLLAQQQIRWGAFLADLGRTEEAKAWMDRAAATGASTYAVQQAVREALAAHPELNQSEVSSQ